MARITSTTKSNVPDLDPDMYDAVVKSVEEAEPSNSPFDKGLPREMITYRLRDEVDDEGKPLTLRQWVTIYPKLRPKQALYGVIKNLLNDGDDLQEDEDWDTADLVGKACRVQWGQKEKGEGMGITAVYGPARAKRGGRQAVTAAEIDEI